MKKIILSIAFIIILVILPLSSAYNLNYSIEKHQVAISESKINYPDDIYEWQDDTNSSWIGPYPSGQEITVSHTWDEENTYTIRAKAKDTLDVESPWSTLEVTMPVNQHSYSFPLLQRLLERFPNAFPILRQILGL